MMQLPVALTIEGEGYFIRRFLEQLQQLASQQPDVKVSSPDWDWNECDNLPIRDLCLSDGAFHRLWRSDIQTVGQLRRLTAEDIRAMWRPGSDQLLNEVVTKLGVLDLALAKAPDQPAPPALL